MKKITILIAIILKLCFNGSAQNSCIVNQWVNGDFENTTNQPNPMNCNTLNPVNNITWLGLTNSTYISRASQNWQPAFVSELNADHTLGTNAGSYLYIDPRAAVGTVMQIQQSINVVMGQSYTFQAWVCDMTTSAQANTISLTINNTLITSTILNGSIPSPNPRNWVLITGTWIANSTNAICAINCNTPSVSGFDFAVDDISFIGEMTVYAGEGKTFCAGTPEIISLGSSPTGLRGASCDGLSYKWTPDPNLTLNTFMNPSIDVSKLPVGQNIYLVTVTDKNGSTCSDAVTITITKCCQNGENPKEFTKSYAGPNGWLDFKSDEGAVHQNRQIKISHIKKLPNNNIVVAGSTIMDNIESSDIWNYFISPEWNIRVPIIQKMNQIGQVLVSKRIDQLIPSTTTYKYLDRSPGKKVVDMEVDNDFIYLLVTNNYIHKSPNIEIPNYFEIIKLDHNLVPVISTSSNEPYIKVSLSNTKNIAPSDMILSGNILKVLSAYKENPINNISLNYVAISNIPTNLKTVGFTKLLKVNQSPLELVTGKFALNTTFNYLYFNYNVSNNISYPIAYLGILDLSTFSFISNKSYFSSGGGLYPEGLKWDNISNKLIMYGSVDPVMSNSKQPSLHFFDQSLNLNGYGIYNYIPKSNTNNSNPYRDGIFGSEAFIDEIYPSNEGYVVHTLLKGVLNSPSTNPELYTMVPGYFSISKSAGSLYNISPNFPSIFNGNIFNLHERSKNITTYGEDITGKFDDHFINFESRGAMLKSTDASSSQIYSIDGQRTISVMGYNYQNAQQLNCFETIDINKYEYSENPISNSLPIIQKNITGTLTIPFLKITNNKIVTSCCLPEYIKSCSNIGDIQVNFTFDCITKKLKATFSGSDASKITMIQAFAKRNNEGFYYPFYFPSNTLSDLQIDLFDNTLLENDQYCIVVYTENGCMKQFCKQNSPVTVNRTLKICNVGQANPVKGFDPLKPENYPNAVNYTLKGVEPATANYNFNSNPPNTPIWHALIPGKYKLELRDANGCTYMVVNLTVELVQIKNYLCEKTIDVPCDGLPINPNNYVNQIPDDCHCKNKLTLNPIWTPMSDFLTGLTFYQTIVDDAKNDDDICERCTVRLRFNRINPVNDNPPIVITLPNQPCSPVNIAGLFCNTPLNPMTKIHHYIYKSNPDCIVNDQTNLPDYFNLNNGIVNLCCVNDNQIFCEYYHVFEALLPNGCICRIRIKVVCLQGPPQINQNTTQSTSGLNVFPTITEDAIHIESLDNQALENVDIILRDINGKLINRQQYAKIPNTINAANLAPGMYIVETICNNRKQVFKVIKQ